jgi:hypothetical protein
LNFKNEIFCGEKVSPLCLHQDVNFHYSFDLMYG